MKTLLFGPGGVGKTSLMRTTCLGYSFVNVANLKPTKGISRETFVFRGLMDVIIWDAGGQERYLKKYFSETQAEKIFGDVDVAIFMVDSITVENSIRKLFDDFIGHLLDNSPNVKRIYVLINKIDLENSREDDVFDLLTQGLEPEIHKRCAFTPVSVKKGSAQHRLIEILDTTLQNSIIEMQKMTKIKSLLEGIKSKINIDIVLFNKPDGLIISSTFANKFETEPLKFLTLKLGSLESNLHSVYSKIMTVSNREVKPIELSYLVYESEINFVLVKEITDTVVIMGITSDKKKDLIETFINAVDELDEVKEIKESLS